MDEAKQQPQPAAESREEWQVPVLDAVRGQPCTLIVAVNDTRVVVVPPYPYGYVVPPESISVYCDALNTAKSVAEHRKSVRVMDPRR